MDCSFVHVLRAIECNAIHFRSLKNVIFNRTKSGEIAYRLGSNCIVFHCSVEGVDSTLRYFISDNPYRKDIYNEKFLERECGIPIHDEWVEWVDVLCIDKWIEGVTLEQRLTELVIEDDLLGIRELSRSFNRLALDLLGKEIAHGDVTLSNILIDSNEELHLIDFDAAFIPALIGMPSCEVGTEGYQHPLRTHSDFDRHIDDYSIAVISTLLSLLSITTDSVDRGKPMFSPKYLKSLSDELLGGILNIFDEEGDTAAYCIARELRSSSLRIEQLRLFLNQKL